MSRYEIRRAGKVIAAIDRGSGHREIDVSIVVPVTRHNPDGWAYFRVHPKEELHTLGSSPKYPGERAVDEILAEYGIRLSTEGRAALRQMISASPNPTKRQWAGAAILAAAVIGGVTVLRWVLR